ncbi:MAG: phage holin family protein [Oscillospiraceae bacterium]|jgi:uncharacterized membrane protein YvlD (DUF360 family)|nr:phage holin family protein [Oscillospiraceae bacterium]
MRRIIWKSLGTVAAVIGCSYYLPGIHCEDWTQAAAAGMLLAAAYLLFRPVARILVGAFNLATLGLVGTIVDAALFMACAGKIPGLTVDGFHWALLAALIVNAARIAFGLVGKLNRA